jgi:hypothetical protein
LRICKRRINGDCVFCSKEAWLGGEDCKRRMENRNTVVVKCSVI